MKSEGQRPLRYCGCVVCGDQVFMMVSKDSNGHERRSGSFCSDRCRDMYSIARGIRPMPTRTGIQSECMGDADRPAR